MAQYLQIKKDVFHNHFEAINALLSGKIDAFAYPEALMYSTLKHLNIDDKILSFGQPLFEIKRAIGVSTKHSALLSPINKELEKFLKTEKYRLIYKKYFGSPQLIQLTKEQIIIYILSIVSFLVVVLFFLYRSKILLTHKQLQEQLALKTKDLNETKNYLQIIFDINPNILFTTKGYNLIKPNQQFLNFVGYNSAKEFLKEYDCICDFFIKKEEYLGKYLDNGQLWVDYILDNPEQTHKVFIIKNNQEFIFQVLIRPISKNNEYLILLHDITLLENIQKSLESSNEDLQQFAYIASHDLQEPLRMVSSYLQLIEKRYKDKLDSDGIEFINFAVDGAKRMKNLINGLLQFSRVQTKGLPFESVDMNNVFEEVLSNISLTIEEKQATIDIAKNLPSIRGDKHQMIQLFQNIISNSLKYCETRPHVTVNITEEEESIIFSIKDNGIGIEEEYFEKIFLIFQRLHSKESHYDGTGIGLAVSKRIVQRHGGKIWLESKPNEGTTFYISFLKQGVENV